MHHKHSTCVAFAACYHKQTQGPCQIPQGQLSVCTLRMDTNARRFECAAAVVQVKAPRIRESAVQLECKLRHVYDTINA